MKILVASSGNHPESGEPAVAAGHFPWPAGSQIHVISVAEVIQPVMVGMVPDLLDPGAVEVHTSEEAKDTATQAAEQLRALGLAAQAIVAKGDAETAILDHAKSWGADLIVVGFHDRSLIERLLVSSVSDGVIKHAPCSVLVVKPGGLSV